MEILQQLFMIIVTLGVLVTFHEFGHFWVARRCGVKVLRFCVGFGKPFFIWRDRSGTEFAIAAIPLGGYVKMLDEREGDVPPELLSQSFTRKPVGQRIAIIAAGPIANFLLAFVLYYLVMVSVGVGGVAPVIGGVTPNSIAERAGLMAGEEIVAVEGDATPTLRALHERLLGHIGDTGPVRISVKSAGSDAVRDTTAMLDRWLAGQEEPDLIGGLGIETWEPKVVAGVLPDSPAARAGMHVGDRIESADGAAVASWKGWVQYVRARPQQPIELVVLRDGERVAVTLVPDRKVDDKGNAYGQVGVEVDREPAWPPEMLRHFQYSPLAAVPAAIQRSGEMIVLSLQSIKKLALGEISPKNLSGPITIAKVATASAKSGLEYYLDFLAFFSISLGVLNLLPIPVLDGGHILFALPELVTGKPLSERVQAMGLQIGMFIIVGIMVLALYNDVMRVF